MASRPEGGLGHADHRDAELSVRVRTQAGPAARVKVGVTVNHQKPQTAQPAQDRADRREFTQIELTGPVRQHLRHVFSAFGHYLAEAGISSHHGRGPRTPGTQVVARPRSRTRGRLFPCPELA
jgi:hypothetical protein